MFGPLAASHTRPVGNAASRRSAIVRSQPPATATVDFSTFLLGPLASSFFTSRPVSFALPRPPPFPVVPLPCRTHYHVACHRIIRYNITYAVVSCPDLVEPTALLLQQSYRVPFSVRTVLTLFCYRMVFVHTPPVVIPHRF